MSWHALYYPLEPGSEDQVGKLFAASARPSFQVLDDAGRPAGRLLGTMAFVGAAKAIRVIEIDGALPQVAGHMSRQPEVRDFERQLESHLSVPRDMRSPEGARAFFQQAALNGVRVDLDEQGDPEEWTGAFHPVLPGHEPAVRELAAAPAGNGSRPAASMSFVGREKAMWLTRSAAPAVPAALAEHLPAEPGPDSALRCVLSRRHDQDL